MEAVPRLPMLSFKLKESPEATSFANLKQYIAETYQEDPESYSKEIYQLESLRGTAVRPTQDVAGCSTLKRYYAQLHSLQNRFQLPADSQLFNFGWADNFSSSIFHTSNIKYEMASILYNVATLHVCLGTEEARTTPDSMKLACTHFQCAAWCYDHLKDNYALVLKGDISTELLIFMQHLSFAQAQECILEKSLADNRKSAIVAKVTAQIITYYNSAMAALLTNGEDGQLSDLVGGKLFKEWKRYVKFKILYLSSILHLYQGQDSEEQKKMGERCALYQAAFDKLEEARKESKGMQPADVYTEALTFTMDVVEAKRKEAKSDNDFIYHEEVPDMSTISAIQGANLVKGIGFDVTDPAILGEDIFHRLVPMQAHETSSLYSEEKAALLRKVGSRVEERNEELQQFMSSLNLESLNANNSASAPPDRLPQGLVDRCAALSAKSNAIPDLVASMSSLAEICADVESMLSEIGQLFATEERNEAKYQEKVGHQRPGGHIVELSREYQKYTEAHNKAGESNETLRKAMGLHVANLKVLALPLQQIQAQLPVAAERVDEKTLKDLRKLVAKVSEMQHQRAELVSKLRSDVTNDDITAQVIAWGDKKLDKLFRKEIGKHDQTVTLLEQNLSAQKNILRALTNEYAKSAPALKNANEMRAKRDSFYSSLMTSYDVYEDLLGKCAKGLEFYRKLHGNVQKLLSRVRAAIDVQNEERQQQLKASGLLKTTVGGAESPKVASGKAQGPKLKDYINSGAFPIGGGSSKSRKSSAASNESQYIPTVRPSPLGSENITPADCNSSTTYATGGYSAAAGQQYNYSGGYMQGQQYYHPQQPNSGATTYPTSTASTGYTNPMYQTPPYYEMPAATVDSQSQQPGQYYQQQQYPAAQPDLYANQWTGAQQPAASMTQNFSNMSLGQQQTTTDQYYNQQAVNYGYGYPTANYAGVGAVASSASATTASYSAPAATASTNSFNYSVPTAVSTPATNYSTPTATNSFNYPGQNAAPLVPTNYSSPASAASSAPAVNYSVPAAVSTATTNYPVQTTDSYNYSIPATAISGNYSAPAASASTTPLNYGASSGNYYSQQYSTPSATAAITTTVQSPQQPYVPFSPPAQSVAYNYGANTDLANASATNLQPATSITGFAETTPAVIHHQNYQNLSNYQEQQSQTVNTVTPQPTLYQQPSGQMDRTSKTVYPPGYNAPEMNSYQTPTDGSQQYGYTAGGGGEVATQQSNDYGQTNYGNYGGYQYNSQQYPTSQTTPVVTQPTPATPAPPVVQPTPAVVKTPAPAVKKSSNFDLLSDIDFSMSPNLPPVEVVPLQPTPAKSISEVSAPVQPERRVSGTFPSPKIEMPPPLSTFSNNDRKMSADNLSICSDLSSIDQNFDWDSVSVRNEETTIAGGKDKPKDAFGDPKVVKWFHKEVERLERFIENLTVKTLNGTTPLDSTWKELQDKLVKDESKRTVAVAKLFPDKNRSNDSIPYDHARVLLPTTTDDYINAAYVKELGPGCSTFILNQTPLANTVADYWSMVWSQKANTLVCLHPPNEILDTFWPQELNKETTFGDFSITLLKQFDLSHCIERSLKITMHGSDAVLVTSLLQIKAWAKAFSPANNVLGIAGNIITSYKLQNPDVKNQPPIVCNCLTGAERSGLVTVAIAAILATTSAKRPVLINVVDVWYRICGQRKAALRDVANLQLSMQIVLNHGHSILNKRGIMTSYQMKNAAQPASVIEKEEIVNDPLNDLDPLWKLKGK